jgi:hypothetical protein
MINSRQGIPFNNEAYITMTCSSIQAYRNQQQTNNALRTARPGMNVRISGNASSPSQTHRYMATSTHRYTVLFPALLHGSRCYTDVLTMPDQVSLLPIKAGIGHHQHPGPTATKHLHNSCYARLNLSSHG